jgi:hypothetical protein
MHPLLVEVKLSVPSVRRGVVNRPRVGRTLDAGIFDRHSGVAAEAGWATERKGDTNVATDV